MTWSTTSDINRFVAAAGSFLSTRPVAHTVLLTETAYLDAHPGSAHDQLFGWWRDDSGNVGGAFVQAPRHPPIASTLVAQAVETLAQVLPDPTRIGVEGSQLRSVVAAWARRGIELRPVSRLTVYRLGRLRPASSPGRARIAEAADRPLLVRWYEQLMALFPDDPSDLEYVVDDPLAYGGITLWEVDGHAVAMAGRSRMVSGMVRMGPVYSPHAEEGHETAVLSAACRDAQRSAQDVLIMASSADAGAAAAYRRLGFEAALERVMLARCAP